MRRMMRTSFWCMAMAALFGLGGTAARADDRWVVYDGSAGPGKGKHIVFVTGDEEYRSEETGVQISKILAKHHGFKVTVLFAIDPKTGEINPNISNIPGLETLKTADLAILFLRFRNLPDEQMAHLVDYIESGRPIIGLRTSTHAFNNPKSAKFAKYHWQSKVKGYEQGFGRQVLGETWISHHGGHGTQSTLGVIPKGKEDHPILRGIKTGAIWGPTDVYGVRLPLPGDSDTLVLGSVLSGMKATDPPVMGKQNDPMMPIAWTRGYKTESGKTARVFTTTMGASTDIQSEGLRRLLVNASYWCMGMEAAISPKSSVDIVGPFDPRPFRNNGFVKGLKPADLRMP